MKLYAISDLHLSSPDNRRLLQELPAYPDDWLILAGDIGETLEHLSFALTTLGQRFRQLVWVPGNHDLWTTSSSGEQSAGEEKYLQLVDLCRQYDVLTPEDPYAVATFGELTVRVIPLFLLYDYSFRPAHIPREAAVGWASRSGVVCADEHLLLTNPYPDVSSWCGARCDEAERRLESVNDGMPSILINHFPLRQDLIWIPLIPRFTIWCGTRRTEDWHLRFNAAAVVYGHLHVPTTQYRDGIRFDEVSLGYPRQWQHHPVTGSILREILPDRSAG